MAAGPSYVTGKTGMLPVRLERKEEDSMVYREAAAKKKKKKTKSMTKSKKGGVGKGDGDGTELQMGKSKRGKKAGI